MVKFEGLIPVSEIEQTFNRKFGGYSTHRTLRWYVLSSPLKHRYHAYLYALKTGAYSVHQLLHHASQLPNGKMALFHSAIMQSNAIL